MMHLVCALSKRDFNARFQLSQVNLDDDISGQAADLIRKTCPSSLLIGDGRLSPQVLKLVFAALPAALPAQLFLYGRWMEAFLGTLPQTAELLEGLGYTPAFDFDPNICQAFTVKDQEPK